MIKTPPTWAKIAPTIAFVVVPASPIDQVNNLVECQDEEHKHDKDVQIPETAILGQSQALVKKYYDPKKINTNSD